MVRIPAWKRLTGVANRSQMAPSYLAGIGASGALLGAAILVFVGLIVGVSFNSWPGPKGPAEAGVITVRPGLGGGAHASGSGSSSGALPAPSVIASTLPGGAAGLPGGPPGPGNPPPSGPGQRLTPGGPNTHGVLPGIGEDVTPPNGGGNPPGNGGGKGPGGGGSPSGGNGNSGNNGDHGNHGEHVHGRHGAATAAGGSDDDSQGSGHGNGHGYGHGNGHGHGHGNSHGHGHGHGHD